MDVKRNLMDTVRGKMNRLFAVVLSEMESGSSLKEVRKKLFTTIGWKNIITICVSATGANR